VVVLALSKLEEKLLELTRKDPNLATLDGIFSTIKSRVSEYLPAVANSFPHYSRHDNSHIQNIIDNIERILGDERISKLSVGDIWLILVSVYLHDIGMLISHQEEKEIWRSEAFKSFLRSCETGYDEDLRLASKMVGNSYRDVDPLLIKYYVIQLTAEFFRRSHANRSRIIAEGKSSISELFAVTIPDSFQNIWSSVGKIVELHALDFDCIFDKELNHKKFPIPSYGDYHPRLAAALLRLGDLCDVQRGRFNEMSISQFGLLPLLSAQHYYKHKTMDDPSIDNEKIIMRAKINFDDIKQNLPNEHHFTETEKEDFCQQIVYQHVNWYNMLNSDLTKFSQYRDMIFPVDIKKDVPEFTPSINVNRKELQITLDDLRFNFSREKAFELIEGYSLYDDPLTFVRELIQNSLDALKLKMWHDLNMKNGWFEKLIPKEKRDNKATLMPFDFIDCQEIYNHYSIKISVKYDRKKKKAEVTFYDNGIGITYADIKNKIIQTGSSWQSRKYQDCFETMPAWLRPSGSFGIGLHSVFAVANSFRIETCSKDESHIIVLHSGRGNGFVFSRPDKNITQEGTSVILDIDLEKIQKEKSVSLPYEKQLDNPVLDILSNFIKKNVICPLFDVYLYDKDIALLEKDSLKPIACKLCDHDEYGKLFDSDIRNFLFDGLPLYSEFHDERYDVAITSHRPLRFVVWDRAFQMMCVLQPEIFGRYNSSPIGDKYPYKNITFMGISLCDQELKAFYTLSQLHILHVDFMAGNGKEFVTANRKRLKQDKISEICLQLNKVNKFLALFGQKLFSTVMNTDITSRFFASAMEVANSLDVASNSVSSIFKNLKDILNGNEPAPIEQLLYFIFIFRCYISNNQGAFRKHLDAILNIITPLASDREVFFKAFFNLWTSNHFLNNITGLLMKLVRDVDQVLGNDTNFSFAEVLGYGLGHEICRMIEHELSLILADLQTNFFSLTHRDRYTKRLTRSFINEFGEPFCEEFSIGFARGFEVSRSVYGKAFCSSINTGERYKNQKHYANILGDIFFDTTYSISFTHRQNADPNLDIIHNIFYINLPHASCINLLSNDNWAWVLWSSLRFNLPVDTFLHSASDYFRILPDYEYGYHFDKCENLLDIFSADQLVCPVNNLSSQLYDKFPFLWNLRWTKLELREDEFYVTLRKVDNNEATSITASNDVIQKWWKKTDWGLCLGFESYAKILVPHTDELRYSINNINIDVPYWVLILILPTDISGEPRRKYITEADNKEEAVAGIMQCEQVNNIIDYIYLQNVQKHSSCSHEKIKEEYKQFIYDYVIALRS